MTNSPGDGQPQGPYPPISYAPDHPKATTSLVLGIVGLVVCGLVAPFAWKVGRDTVRDIDASQGRLGGRGSAQAGYILGVVGTVLLALGLLAVVLLVLGLGVIGMSASSS